MRRNVLKHISVLVLAVVEVFVWTETAHVSTAPLESRVKSTHLRLVKTIVQVPITVFV